MTILCLWYFGHQSKSPINPSETQIQSRWPSKNGFSSQEYLLAVKIVKTTHSGDSTRRVFFKLKTVQLIFVCYT